MKGKIKLHIILDDYSIINTDKLKKVCLIVHINHKTVSDRIKP